MLSHWITWMMGLVLACFMPSAAPAQTSTIADADALASALRAARGGEVFALEPGNYGALTLGTEGQYVGTVTITSADPENPARFTRMRLNGVRNLVLDRLLFDYVFSPQDATTTKRFQIRDCSDVTVRNSLFDGDTARGISPEEDGVGFAYGLDIRRCADVSVHNNTFFTFYRGLVASEARDISVHNNEFRDIRMDALTFGQMRNIVIEDNHIHSFRRARTKKDHADMIQFLTNGTEVPSVGITIRRNVLNAGDGDHTQSIFMRNEEVDKGKAGPEMFYRDVRIEDNVIINGHLHGITLGEARDVVVRNNTLLRMPGAALGEDLRRNARIPRIKVAEASINVRIERNVGRDVQKSRREGNWIVTQNLVLQDNANPMAQTHYSRNFAGFGTGDPADLNTYAYLDTSMAERTGFGSTLLRNQTDRSEWLAQIGPQPSR